MTGSSAVQTAICQKWEESERGWGTRPDGYSLHLTEFHLRQYIKTHWDSLPEYAPDEYSRPCGTPYSCQVTDEVYQQLMQHDGSFRYLSNVYPGSGGIDGWRVVKS